MKFKIEEHNRLDKNFRFGNSYISMKVDYDDVDQNTTDAAIEVIKNILESHWDEDIFRQKRLKKATETWNINEYNLQSDYESMDDFLEMYK